MPSKKTERLVQLLVTDSRAPKELLPDSRHPLGPDRQYTTNQTTSNARHDTHKSRAPPKRSHRSVHTETCTPKRSHVSMRNARRRTRSLTHASSQPCVHASCIAIFLKSPGDTRYVSSRPSALNAACWIKSSARPEDPPASPRPRVACTMRRSRSPLYRCHFTNCSTLPSCAQLVSARSGTLDESVHRLCR